jgi:arginine decarboxylase
MIYQYATYRDLIDHAYDIDKKWFEVRNETLHFQGMDLMQLIKDHGSPLKISYLPKIAAQIQKANRIFGDALVNHQYTGKYVYSYCTKSSHFHFVLDEVLKQGAQLEISSAYDIQIIKALWAKKKITPDLMVICNGFKSTQYLTDIVALWHEGFRNMIVVIDNEHELVELEGMLAGAKTPMASDAAMTSDAATTPDTPVSDSIKIPLKIGIRIATEEEPSSDMYTSRLGISAKHVKKIFKQRIVDNPTFDLVMIHFFMNSKIKDSAYYRSELSRLVEVYADMRQLTDSIQYLDIGGGFPIFHSLDMEYDYGYMADQIVWTIQHICDAHDVPSPDIVTEFGSFTVGESGAVLYKVIGKKQQNDKEMWYFVNNSFITTLPDTWWIGQKFIVLPLNLWGNQHVNVNLWGITCDSDDYYNSDDKGDALILPTVGDDEALYIGIFHTWAYQESIGGFGGIQHCLIPAPKHLVIDKKDDQLVVNEFSPEQDAQWMLKILWF